MVVHNEKWQESRLKMYFLCSINKHKHKKCWRMVVYYDKWSESHLEKKTVL